MYIAIDLGGTNVRISGSISLHDIKFEGVIKFELEHDFEKDFQRIIEAIKGIAGNDVDAIGIGTPGTYSEDKKSLISAKNITEWVQKPFIEYLSKEFNCPVFADNDAVVASLGEFYYGKHYVKNFIYLTWGTGIGGTLVKNQHNIVLSEKIDWHTYFADFENGCGGNGIIKRYNKTPVELGENEWNNVLKDFVRHIKDVSMKLNEKEIILGGGATAKQKERLKNVVADLAKENIKLHISNLDDEIGLYGAIALVKKSQNKNMKHLIINADDFGYSPIFNEKILELLGNGKITSTTVMVKWITDIQKNQVEKLQELEKTNNISVGLHLDFEAGEYGKQIDEQLSIFRKIFGRNPSHLDIHKSSSFPGSTEIVTEYSKKLGMPCRNWGQDVSGVKSSANRSFLATAGFGSVVDFNDIENWLAKLEEGKYYEICFHPGTYDPNCKSSLNKDREKDVENILRLNDILADYDIQKVSFCDL